MGSSARKPVQGYRAQRGCSVPLPLDFNRDVGERSDELHKLCEVFHASVMLLLAGHVPSS